MAKIQKWFKRINELKSHANYKQYLEILQKEGVWDKFPKRQKFFRDRIISIVRCEITINLIMEEIEETNQVSFMTETGILKKNPLLAELKAFETQKVQALNEFSKLLPEKNQDKIFITKETNPVEKILNAK